MITRSQTGRTVSQRKPYRLTLELQGLPRLQSGVVHWRTRARERNTWRSRVVWAIGNNRPAVPLERARVTVTRYSSVEPDHANMHEAAKPLIDALTARPDRKGLVRGASVIRDDSPDVIGMPTCRWQHTSPKQGRVMIEVEEVIP